MKFRYSTITVVMTIAVILSAAFLYVLAKKFPLRWDTTVHKELSLSEQTLTTLKGLETPVKVFAFFRRGEDLDSIFIRRKVDDVLKEYARRASKIEYRMIDPDPEIELAVQYTITNDGTVVFQSGKNRKDVYRSQLFDYSNMQEQSPPRFSGEGLFTNALLKVTRSKSSVLCFMTGHGERGLNDSSPTGYSGARDYLIKNNFEVKEISLVTESKIPEDCSLLVLTSPRRELPSSEDLLIKRHLEKKKPLFLMTDPLGPSGPSQTLREIGLQWNPDLVLDPDRHFLLGPHYPAPILGDHETTQGLKEFSPILSSARSLKVEEKKESTILLKTSDKAWGETNLNEGEEAKFDKGTDNQGPLTIGVALSDKPSTEGDQGNGRIIAVGDSDFASNGLIQVPGNLDLFLNMIGWLVGEKDQVTIRPVAPEFRKISMTPARAATITYFSQYGYPMLVLGSGLVYWWRRKRR